MYIFMNTLYRSSQARLAACLLAITLTVLWTQPAWANTRQNAIFELELLHKTGSAREKPDEVKSADATFAIAEHYFQVNDLEQSEQFYLLTIQKARIILGSLPKTTTDPASLPPDAYIPATSPPTSSADAAEQTISVPDVEIQDFGFPPLEQGSRHIFEDVTSVRFVGTAGTYSVVKGDNISLVAAKLGVSKQQLIRANKLDQKAFIIIGQKLKYNNRKIVPQRMKEGIVVNIPDLTLYYFKQGKLAVSLPVALGVPVKSGKYDWKTPTGKFRITAKMKDPTWHVPPSIQSEREEHGMEAITSIPPGASNPLGKYAIKTSIPGILIHSTTKPWSIYSFASHGCIRVYPEQMEEFFKAVAVNTPGEIIYKPVKVAITEKGRIFLEVHRDVYHMSRSGLASEVRQLIEKKNLSERVNWQKVESIVRHTEGIAEEISL